MTIPYLTGPQAGFSRTLVATREGDCQCTLEDALTDRAYEVVIHMKLSASTSMLLMVWEGAITAQKAIRET